MVSYLLVDYTEEQIEYIAQLAGNPANLTPAGTEAWEQGRRMAEAIADAFSEQDWKELLNRLSPDRAAKQIGKRPVADRQYLLGLLSRERRPSVESLLSVTR